MEKVSSSLSYDERIELGRGNYSYVYRGLLKNEDGTCKAVAVKRFQNCDLEAPFIRREVGLMQRAGDHQNILRYIRTEEDDDFLYNTYYFMYFLLPEIYII